LHEFYLPICRLVGKILNDNVEELVPRALAACMERPLGAAYLTLSARDATKAALCLEAGAVGVAVVRASTDAAAVRTALERAAV